MWGLLLLFSLPVFASAGEIEIRSDTLKMADGVKLSATFFLPKLDQGKKAPVLLELLPYRKDDEFLARDY